MKEKNDKKCDIFEKNMKNIQCYCLSKPKFVREINETRHGELDVFTF